MKKPEELEQIAKNLMREFIIADLSNGEIIQVLLICLLSTFPIKVLTIIDENIEWIRNTLTKGKV